jgi:hypothetical protein
MLKRLLFILLVACCCVGIEPEPISGAYTIHNFYRSDFCSCGPSEYELVFGSGVVYAKGEYSCDDFLVIRPFVGTYAIDGDAIKLFGTSHTWLEEADFELLGDVLMGRWEMRDALIEIILVRS